MATGKRKRKTKVSRGIHAGGGKVRLSGLQKVLLDKGQAQTIKSVEIKETWGRAYARIQDAILGRPQ